jgi:hypothetical protein
MKEVFNRKVGKSKMLPVFIGGHPRSGTTLLGDILGSHPFCICTPESQFKVSVYQRLEIKDKEYFDVNRAFEKIKKHWRYKIWAIDEFMDFEEKISSYEDLILILVRKYAIKNNKFNASIWVDHTPSNIQFAELLNYIFPEAKFIHIIRDGRAVAASQIPLDWGPNTISGAAYSWMEAIKKGLSAEELLRDKIIKVKYEELVADAEIVLKKICDFLEINYFPEMLQGGGFKVPEYTIKQHLLLGKPPDRSRINVWEKKLTKRQIEIFESIAGEFLEKLNYTLLYGKNAKSMNLSEKLLFYLYELWRGRIINKIRHKKRKEKGIILARKQ